MSAGSWNGHSLPERSDSPAARCAALLERGIEKFKVASLPVEIKPRRAAEVVWVKRKNFVAKKRPGRTLKDYPNVLGMTIAQIVVRFDVTPNVAGRLLALQSPFPSPQAKAK